MLTYVVASENERLEHNGRSFSGARCGCAGRGHYLYALALTENEVERLRRAPRGGRGGRKQWLRADGSESWYVSYNPTCRWPGSQVTVRPQTDGRGDDAGPTRLSPAAWDSLARLGVPLEGDPPSDLPPTIDAGTAPRPEAAARKPRPRGPALHQLHEEHLIGISARIAELAATAADRSNPHREIARAQMKGNFWRWTADAFRADEGVIKFDGMKHCCLHLVHSEKAELLWEKGGRTNVLGNELRHEHAVPSEVLAALIVGAKRTPDAVVHATLKSLCHAVVLTKAEDALFRKHGLTSRMPPTWDGRDPWARYRAVGLLAQLRKPLCPECSPRIPLP
jgi:hypothetical protein